MNGMFAPLAAALLAAASLAFFAYRVFGPLFGAAAPKERAADGLACGACGQWEKRPEARFCSACGQPLRPACCCGQPLSGGDRFCPGCGRDLAKGESDV